MQLKYDRDKQKKLLLFEQLFDYTERGKGRRMRLFIALLLDDRMKNELVSAQSRMKRLGVRGNYTKSENLHLTLAFIGDYPDPYEVIDVIEKVSFEPFKLKLDGIGAFRNLWWAGIKESDELKAVVKRLRRELAQNGIPFDRKRFSPHITLIRKPLNSSGRIPEEILSERRAAEMTVDHVSLMLSERGRHGMNYTELYP